jgi:hypothetical protein
MKLKKTPRASTIFDMHKIYDFIFTYYPLPMRYDFHLIDMMQIFHVYEKIITEGGEVRHYCRWGTYTLVFSSQMEQT